MARKLNKNLVGIMVLVIMVLLTTTGIVLFANLPGQDPTKYASDAEGFREKGEYERAMRTFLRAYQKDPAGNPDYLVSAAECAIEDGQVPMARSYLNAAKLKDSTHKATLELELDIEFEIARILGAAVHWVRVIELAEKMLSIDSFKDSSSAHHVLGVAYLKQRAKDRTYEEEGIAALKRAHEIDPGDVDVITELIQEWWRLIEKKKQSGDFQESESIKKTIADMIESAIAKSAGPDDAERLADLRRLEAQHMILVGSREEGIARLEKLASQETSRIECHLLIGTLFLNNRRYGLEDNLGKAREYLEKAIEIDSEDGRAYLNLSSVYKRQRVASEDAAEIEAVRTKEKALYERGLDEIKRSKHFRRMKDNIARYYFINELFSMELERARKAEEESEKTAKLAAAEAWREKLKEEWDPKTTEVKFMNARLLLVRGEVIAATREAEAAKRLVKFGTNLEVERLLAALYMQQQQWGAAQDSLSTLLEAVPYEPALRIAMGEVMLKQNRPSDALLHLKLTSPAILSETLRNDKRAIRLRMVAYQQLKQFEQAEAESKLLGEGSPADELRTANGMILSERYSEAETKIKEVLKADPDNKHGIRLLFSLYQRTDRIEEMRAFIKSLTARDPSNRLYQRYELLIAADGDEEARDDRLRQFIEEEEDEFNRYYGLAAYYKARENYEEARKYLDKVEALRPNDTSVIENQMNVAMLAKDWERAERYVRKHGELNIDGTEGKIAQGRLMLSKGEQAKAEDRAQDAKTLFEEAIDLMSAGVQIYPKYSLGWTYLANACVSAGRVSDAKKHLNQALKVNPANGYASMMLAKIALAEEDERTERRYLEAASKWLPNEPWVKNRLQEYREKENPEEGIIAREKRKRDKPDDVKNLVRLARLYSEPTIAKYDKAASNYREALRLADNDLALAREMARFYGSEAVGRPAEGEKLLMELVQAEEDMKKKALAAASLAQFYESQNVLATADRWYRTAVSFDPSREILLVAAEFYARTRKYDDALEYYERASKRSTDLPGLLREVRSRIIAVLLETGDLDRAKERIDAYVEQYPDDEEGMIYEGAYHRTDGDIEKAKEAFNRHLEKNPENGIALWQRGQLFILTERWERAIEDLKKAKAINPDGYGYQHRIALADALIEAERGDEAVSELKQIHDDDPENQAVAEALADAYVRVRPPRFEDAEKLIYQCIRRYPRDYRWSERLGILGRFSQNWDMAIEGFERAAEVGQYQPQTIRDLFLVYRKVGRHDAIIEYANKKRRVVEEIPQAMSTLAWAYAQAGDQKKSFDAFEGAFATTGADYSAYTKVVQDMVEILGPKAALERAQVQANSDPENVDKQRALVHLLRLNDQVEEALAVCDRIVSLAVRDADKIFARLAKGMLLSSQSRFEQAKAEYEAVLQLNPDQPMALNNLAYELAEKLNNPAEALPYARRASRLQPNDANVLDTYGWVLAMNGRDGEAVGTLLRALDVDRENLDAMYHLGRVYMQRNDLKEAELRLVKAKDLATAQDRTRDLPKIIEALNQLKEQSGR